MEPDKKKEPNQFDFDEYLKQYYQHLFPHKEMFEWLSYGNKDYFINREFSFTLSDNIWTRYRSYNDLEAFSKDIKDSNPRKIDIGPIYSTAPKLKQNNKKFVPLEKELVFDIDMTDYDDVRNCCSGAKVCTKCWLLMTIALKIVHRSLIDDFGFKNILWVFSGRRGIHCWVGDSRARKLSQEGRGAIADYLSVVSKEGEKSRKMGTKLAHPSLQRAYDQVLLPLFKQLIKEQELFNGKERQEKILSMIADSNCRNEVSKYWSKRDPSKEHELMWEDLEKAVSSMSKKNFTNPIYDIVFTFAYPRLDIHVSKGLNHLLKSPFCVHPSTGFVCIPIDPENCEQFDPTGVPDLHSLITEINEKKKGSLKPHIQFFRSSFLEPLQSKEKQNKQKEQGTHILEF